MRVHWGKLPLLPTLWLATPLTCYPASLATGPKVCSVTSEKVILNWIMNLCKCWSSDLFLNILKAFLGMLFIFLFVSLFLKVD